MANYPDDDSHQSIGARLHGYNPIRSQWEPVTINSEGQIATESTATVTVSVTGTINTRDVLSSLEHTAVTVSTTPVEITAISSQKIVRLAPVSASTVVYWGPTSAVTASGYESFNQSTPLSVLTNSSVWLFATAASVIVSVYRGS